MGVIREDGTVEYVDNAPEDDVVSEADYVEQEPVQNPVQNPRPQMQSPEQDEFDQFF